MGDDSSALLPFPRRRWPGRPDRIVLKSQAPKVTFARQAYHGLRLRRIEYARTTSFPATAVRATFGRLPAAFSRSATRFNDRVEAPGRPPGC